MLWEVVTNNATSAVFAFTLIVCVLTFKLMRSWSRKYPPGPRGLPLVGYLPYLSELEHFDFCKLHETYGKIFSLQMGIRPTIVLADFKLIKEAFNNDKISERPPTIFALSDTVTHFAELEGRYWKESRRFILSSLRNLGMGKNKLGDIVSEEAQTLVDRLGKYKENEDVDLHEVLYPAVTRIIISLICGKDLKEDDAFADAVDLYNKSFFPYLRIQALLYFLPFLRPFVSFLYPEMKVHTKGLLDFEQLLWKEIGVQEDKLEDHDNQNYMAHFLTAMKMGIEKGTTFTKRVLNGNSQVMLSAGSDTTITTVKWTLMLLAEYPEVQEKVYREIVQVIGKERPPGWQEREDFPYLDAVLAESSRFKTIVPLGDAHWTMADTSIGQHDVPKGAVVFGNIHAVHGDPDLWDEPERFNPDRFMTPDGKRAKDPEYFMPFSIGKRICPGEKLARMEVFVFICTIVQHFRILPPKSGFDWEGELFIVYRPKKPIVRVQARE